MCVIVVCVHVCVFVYETRYIHSCIMYVCTCTCARIHTYVHMGVCEQAQYCELTDWDERDKAVSRGHVKRIAVLSFSFDHYACPGMLCVCVYIYIYIYISIYVIHLWVYADKCMCVYICIETHAHTHAHMCKCTRPLRMCKCSHWPARIQSQFLS